MKVFVTGATGVLGTSAIRALLAAGYEVGGLARTADKVERLEASGVGAATVDLFAPAQLAEVLEGYDAVCNLATHIPVGRAALRPGAWRTNDAIHTEGARAVVAAAKQAGVRRLIQESVSWLYADGNDEWLDESSPLSVTRATEPAAEAETHAETFACSSRVAVILRFGNVVGDDPLTRWRFERVRSGQPVGLGQPQGWIHVVHPDDLGSAVVAALEAPGGVYNLGAEPVQRLEFYATMARAAGRDEATFMSKLALKLAGERTEPLTRSHRVMSQKLADHAGWNPLRPKFDASWLEPIVARAS